MYDTETDPFDWPSGHELLRRLRVLAAENFPDIGLRENSCAANAAGVIIANGWLTLEQARDDHPALLEQILTENGSVRE